MYYFIQWRWIPFCGGLLVLVALNLNLSRTVVGQKTVNIHHHDNHDAAVAIENSLGSHHYSTMPHNNANEDAPLCQETTVVNCVGISAVNATCLYRNLYIRLAHQSVLAYTIRGSPSNAWFQSNKNGQNSVLIHLEGLHNDTYPIQVHSFESQHALNEYCTSMTSTTSWRHIREPDDGLYAVFTTHHYQNIGHAIFDGLWPLMLGMRQVLFDKKQEESLNHHVMDDSLLFHVVPLQFFTNQRKTGRQGSTQSMKREKVMATDAFQAIAGKEGRVYDHLLDIMNNTNSNHHQKDTILVLPRAVVGAGHRGQRAMTADYKLFQGEQFLRPFRDRVYQSLGITPINITRQRQEPHFLFNQKQQHIHVRIFDNKRYSPREKRLMHQLIEEYNNQSNSTNSTNTSSSNMTIRMHYVQWSEYPTFAQQIQLIAQTHVYISGPGTGLMLSTFLPDGAVVINLGQYPMAYMEEYLAAASPHIHALYYNRCQQHHLQYDSLRVLIQQAVDLVVSASSAHGSSTNTHTTIDNDSTTTDHNRSPVGRAFVEFMQRMAHDYHPLPREAVYDVLGWDVHASLWAEELMFEKPGLLADVERAYGWNVSHVRDVLQAVRHKHRIANCFAKGSSLWPTKEHVRNSFAYRFFPDEDDG